MWFRETRVQTKLELCNPNSTLIYTFLGVALIQSKSRCTTGQCSIWQWQYQYCINILEVQQYNLVIPIIPNQYLLIPVLYNQPLYKSDITSQSINSEIHNNFITNLFLNLTSILWCLTCQEQHIWCVLNSNNIIISKHVQT